MPQASAKPLSAFTGLAPYTGPFGFDQAAHLLRRATFGATHQQVKEVAALGLDAAIEALFADEPMPEPPLNPNFAEDPYVDIGETWIDAPYDLSVAGLQGYRNQSLRAWTLNLLRASGLTLREKMVLFWHNHFVTGDIQDAKFVYKYITLLRQNALGNFRELAKSITIDPAMLRYLNGNDNTAASPNENYARELLELFTIGKGPQAGPGDYTNYTEDDVVEMAKVLTGWRDRGFNTQNTGVAVTSEFVPNRHNTTTKQLSYRFDNIQIGNLGNQEYAHLIDVIFTKDECARFICRKLYRWFVYYEIPQSVEDEVIVPMAQIMVDNDYQIRPALEALLRSEHFFDILNVGPMIKNPVDFVASLLRVFEVGMPVNDLERFYRVQWAIFRNTLNAMQMPYYDPPSVAGWKAYYQEPGFYRTWVSSVTLTARQAYTNVMLTNGITAMGFAAKVDVLKFAATMDDPYEPNSLIAGFVKTLFPQPITQTQHDFLKNVLLPGLPDYEWGLEYGDYINNPNDPDLKAAVETKLRNLLMAMLNMPEYYLS